MTLPTTPQTPVCELPPEVEEHLNSFTHSNESTTQYRPRKKRSDEKSSRLMVGCMALSVLIVFISGVFIYGFRGESSTEPGNSRVVYGAFQAIRLESSLREVIAILGAPSRQTQREYSVEYRWDGVKKNTSITLELIGGAVIAKSQSSLEPATNILYNPQAIEKITTGLTLAQLNQLIGAPGGLAACRKDSSVIAEDYRWTLHDAQGGTIILVVSLSKGLVVSKKLFPLHSK